MTFGESDMIDVPRSSWDRTFTHKTTFNAGDLVPIYFNEDIIPGTTITNKTSMVVRMQTPIYPVMDNLYLDYFWFRAPKYYYWEHFKNQMGQNDLGAWSQTIEYTTPTIKVTTAYGPNDLASYLGVPIGITGFEYDRLGISLYCGLWNNWFRSQVLQAPIILDKTDSDLTSDGTINTGYGLLPVCKTHDSFTSLLIEPERSLPGMTNGVTLPLGTTAPVIGNGNVVGFQDTLNMAGTIALYSETSGGSSYRNVGASYFNAQQSPVKLDNEPVGAAPVGNNGMYGLSQDPAKSGMIADLTNATAASLNALFLATATQRLLYQDAVYGTIYRDILRGYGVLANSQDTMIEEYLGGSRVPINIETVLQQSETTSASPLGETGAYSVTVNTDTDFTKSFTTHDMLICVACVRIAQHTYQQGLNRMFSRMRRLDHYHPTLSHIANQPKYNREIFLQSDSVVNSAGTPINDDVFGYQEAWQEYLIMPNRISGELLSQYAQSLDAWHYGDDYATLPVLDEDWIVEDKTLIDRTLAVQSTEANQFFGDFYFEQHVVAPIPLARTPGLIGFTHM